MNGAAIDQGGSAFPTGQERDPYGDILEYAQPGMSLRDYAAIHSHYDPEGMSVAFAEHLVGRSMPRAPDTRSADPVDIAQFWIDVEAAYRFAAADAFLRARKGGAA